MLLLGKSTISGLASWRPNRPCPQKINECAIWSPGVGHGFENPIYAINK
jgi:hypothetical protein